MYLQFKERKRRRKYRKIISEDLRKTFFGIVDWQLESEETGYVKEAFEKLLVKGFSEESYRAGLEEIV